MTQQLATDLHRLAQNLYDLLSNGAPEDVRQLAQLTQLFHRYSLRNALLIWLQKPDATMVAGYQTWKKAGRYVRKGEKGIRIWAPKIVKITRTIVDEETGEVRKVEEERLVGFRPVYVWDVSQTDGEPLPQLTPPHLSAQPVDVSAWARAVEISLDVTVVFKPLPDDVNGFYGFYDTATRCITVASNRNIAQQAQTLLHEAAHAMLHNCPKGSKEQERRFELEAEAVAALAATLLGIDGAIASAWHYIATHYTADTEEAAKDFTVSMTRIIRTAETLFSIITKQTQETQQAA